MTSKRARAAAKNGPEFVRFFGPLLDTLRALGDSGRPKEITEKIAISLNLSDEILNRTNKKWRLALRQSGGVGTVLFGKGRIY